MLLTFFVTLYFLEHCQFLTAIYDHLTSLMKKKSMQFLWSLQSLLHCKSFYQDPLTGKTFTAAHLFKTFVLQLSIHQRSIFHFHKWNLGLGYYFFWFSKKKSLQISSSLPHMIYKNSNRTFISLQTNVHMVTKNKITNTKCFLLLSQFEKRRGQAISSPFKLQQQKSLLTFGF